MSSSSKRASMAKKWQKLGGAARNCSPEKNSAATFLTKKGHFAVYTADENRFLVPLACLSNGVFRKLLKMSEDEFGLAGNKPITLPCDAGFVEYLITLIQQGVSTNKLEHALTRNSGHRTSSSLFFDEMQSNTDLLICSH